ncbi:MAG: RNA polymerase II mediator complex subunit [Bogoriella megaspora]|nr:MAG: RNA polymerase II mediator complex subunit [Bogoriella megaspora]
MDIRPVSGTPALPTHQAPDDTAQRPAKIPRLQSHYNPVATLQRATSTGDPTSILKPGLEKQESEEGITSSIVKCERGGSNSDIESKAGLTESDGNIASQANFLLPEQRTKTAPENTTPDVDQEPSLGVTLKFPQRPGLPNESSNISVGSFGKVGSALSQNTGLEPPASAPRLPCDGALRIGSDGDKRRGKDDKIADFFAWHGNHPEDSLTEHIVKTGFFDKSQNLQTETNTARLALWSQLKNKQGLQTLSSLLVTALEKRQSIGQVTAGSTFKPPPRITMTDTRRETWLRDLANPEIPIRRQSKHLPHGIKGKALLEQCLNKNIPISRAVWLVKCIGANEMRGLKRRGVSGAFAMGGELKWIREWTMFVQQFIESIVTGCGQEKWQTKMQYGVRLAAQLFQDRLLDRDHFLDWLLTSIETSKIHQLPVWLLLLQVFWKHLVATRQRGRRLAETLTKHLAALISESADVIYNQLVDRLRLLLATLVISHRACLIDPNLWKQYDHVLRSPTETASNPQLAQALSNVDRRNQRLMTPCSKSSGPSLNPKRRVIDLLDTFGPKTHPKQLFSQCRKIYTDTDGLIATVLCWAATKYRTGEHRIYLSARLLRMLRKEGVDTDNAVLSFLSNSSSATHLCHHSIRCIFAELVRSGHVSTGRYLQWLISEGCLGLSEKVAKFHTRLLADIPTQRLPKHVQNLRRILLSQVGRRPDCETEHASISLNILAHRLPSLFAEGLTKSANVISVPSLSISTKFEISGLLRRRLAQHLKANDLAKLKAKADEPVKSEDISALSNEEFCASRDLLEECCDLAVIADILDISLSSNDEEVLASATDTLNYHAKSFAAIGALEPLSDALLDQYYALRTRRPTSRCWLIALRDFVPTVNLDPHLLRLIEHDISRCDQKAVVAVCSPVSDTHEMIQAGKFDLDNEIDRIFASGTSMDEPTMFRVFEKITARIGKYCKYNRPGEEAACFGRWLYRLRTFDEKLFESLMQTWIVDLVAKRQVNQLYQGISSLAGSGCLQKDAFAELVRKFQSLAQQPETHSITHTQDFSAASLFLRIVVPPVAESAHLFSPDAYRLRVYQQWYCETHAEELLQVLRLCLLNVDHSGRESVLPSNVLTVVLRILISNPSAIDAVFGPHTREQTVDDQLKTKMLPDALLRFGCSSEFANLSLERQIASIIEIADEFSLPICLLQLKQLVAFTELNRSTRCEDDSKSMELFSVPLSAAITADSTTWLDLLKAMTPEISQEIRDQAQNALLSLCGNALQDAKFAAEDNNKTIQRYLTVLQSTSTTAASLGGQESLAASLTEQLRAFSEVMASYDEMSFDKSGQADHFLQFLRLKAPWLQVLLDIINISKPLFFRGQQPADVPKKIMDALCTLLLGLNRQACPDLAGYLFDVAATFSDNLPDDIRGQISETFASKPSSDPRMVFLFGSTGPSDAWLTLAHPLVSPHQSIAALPGTMQPPSQHPPSRSLPIPNISSCYGKFQEVKTLPYAVNRWELLQAPPPVGENDTSIDLTLFGARKG